MNKQKLIYLPLCLSLTGCFKKKQNNIDTTFLEKETSIYSTSEETLELMLKLDAISPQELETLSNIFKKNPEAYMLLCKLANTSPHTIEELYKNANPDTKKLLHILKIIDPTLQFSLLNIDNFENLFKLGDEEKL